MTDVTGCLRALLADRYQIEKEIGAGGMATVYVAHDVRRDRPVALKVLRPELSAILGAERFLAEIKTTANLQHPHILSLFDSGEVDGLVFYVMPLVEGESLRDRLLREKQLPVDQAVRIAREVASALDYAHRHGVVHRDIKPENILLHEGSALVADFGIALAVNRSEGGTRMTETGMSLGTPQYMAPEQAMGEREITPKADVYALGCVLYEMLSGEPPFTGPTAQAIFARVLTEEPRSLTVQRRTIPRHIEAAVVIALAKLPADRYQTAAEFAEAISAQAAARAATATSAATIAAPVRRALPWRARSLRNWQVAVAVAVVAGAVVLALPRRGAEGPAVYDVGLPDSAPISFTGGSPWGEGWRALSIAPNGLFAVYVAQRNTTTELWYRSLVDTVARPITGTAGAYHPMVSPDGRSVAYFTGSRLEVTPIAGGATTVIGEVDRPFGAEWVADGRILVADRNSALLRWFDPALRTSADAAAAKVGCGLPLYLPAAHEVLCGSKIASLAKTGDVRDTTRTPLRYAAPNDSTAPLLFGSQFELVDDGLLAFLSPEGVLTAASVDLQQRLVSHVAPAVPGVRREGFTAAGQYDVSASGTLVFAPGANAEVGRFARLKPGGVPVTLPIPAGAHQRFDLSPDGRRLAVVSNALQQQELWVYDLATGHGERWLRAFSLDEPRWDLRGERIIVSLTSTFGGSLVTVVGSPNGSAPPDTLNTGVDDVAYGSFIFIGDGLVVGTTAGKLVRVDLRVQPERVDTLGSAVPAVFAPGSRWMAYMSGVAGRWDVFLERFPPDSRRFRVSPTGGVEPLWLSANRLLFRSGSTWYEVPMDLAAANPVGEPRAVATDPRFMDTSGRSNVLAPDGSIIYVQGTAQATGSFFRVIPRWTEQARRLVRAAAE